MTAAPDDPTADWAEPGPWEVAEGLYRLPLPMPTSGLRAVNVYAILADRVTLIDAGWGSEAARDHLERGLRALGRGLDDVGEVIATHSHSDHYGLAVQLRRDFGTRIRIGEGERENIERVIADWGSGFDSQYARLAQAGAEELAERHRSWIAEHSSQGRSAGEFFAFPDEWIADGDRIDAAGFSLDAVATPGHTVGHLVFADVAHGFVLGGDHLLPTITPSISFEPSRPRLPLHDFLRSHELMLRMPELRLLPSHGHTGMSSHQRSGELLAYHERRLAHALAAVDEGARSALGVARALRWTRRETRLDDLDAFNQMLAVSETIVHLDLLAERGSIAAVPTERGTRYQPLDA